MKAWEEKMNKREMVERALGQLWEGNSLKGLLGLASRAISAENREAWAFELWTELIDALARQAIAIECEVEHESSPAEKLTKVVFYDDAGSILTGVVRGHQGREGKALAIIISIYVKEEK